VFNVSLQPNITDTKFTGFYLCKNLPSLTSAVFWLSYYAHGKCNNCWYTVTALLSSTNRAILYKLRAQLVNYCLFYKLVILCKMASNSISTTEQEDGLIILPLLFTIHLSIKSNKPTKTCKQYFSSVVIFHTKNPKMIL